MGSFMGPIIVVDYRYAWRAAFSAIRAELSAALGDLALSIEHVGSTAVEGLPAKPIIDIDVVIESYSAFDEASSRLKAAGYYHQGDLGIADRHAFGYTGKIHLMAHHLYVCPSQSLELRRHLAFRDYLRAHDRERDWYGEVKRLAAAQYPDDIEGYMAAKAPTILEILERCQRDSKLY